MTYLSKVGGTGTGAEHYSRRTVQQFILTCIGRGDGGRGRWTARHNFFNKFRAVGWKREKEGLSANVKLVTSIWENMSLFTKE